MGSMRRQRFVSSTSGNAVIELALTLPMLLVIVMGIFDFGLMFQRFEVITNAAREGARVGVLPGYHTATDSPDAVNRAIQYLSTGGVTTCMTCVTAVVADTTIPTSPPTTVKQLTVQVNYVHNYVFIGPILNLFGGSLGSVTLTGTSIMRLEAS
jgi:Flp pilus assembly protein TadG